MTDTPVPPPASGGAKPSQGAIRQFLSAFKRKKPKKTIYEMSPGELLKSGDLKNLIIRLDVNSFSGSELKKFHKKMITSKKGREALVRYPDLAVELLIKDRKSVV